MAACRHFGCATVRRTPAGTFQVDPKFVPPLLDFSASDYLVSIARRLVEVLAAKSTLLSGHAPAAQSRRWPTSAPPTLRTSGCCTRSTRTFPCCSTSSIRGMVIPKRLFALMLALAGSLTTFSTQIHPRDLPRYEHDGLAQCFTDLDDKIRILLETVVPTNFVSLPLKLVQPSIYATSISDDKYLHNTRLYLAVSADMPEADLIAKTPYLIKLCSANHIEHLVKHALPGVPVTHVQRPPSAIPVKLNYQYFSINQSGVAWEAVIRARNLAAYVPGDFPSPQLELIVLLPEAS